LLLYCYVIAGGDLAYHLGVHGMLTIAAARFFAAETLLAVQVTHSNLTQ
jgi:hypothetical protein